MGVHAAIHGRGNYHRDGGRETRGRDRVAGQSIGHRPEPARRGRSHDDRLDVVCGADVADPSIVLERKHVDVDRVPAECLEGQRSDERGRGGGHQNAHVGAFGLEQAQQLHRLVGGDRTGNAQGDPTPCQAAALFGHRAFSEMM